VSHYRPYPAYKDSGVEWIGKVPKHWDVVRIKRTAQISIDRSNAIPPGLAYIGLEDVESGSGQYKPTDVTSRQSEDSTVGLFHEGDVLYGKLRPYLRKCISVPMDGACSTEFLVLKPSSVSSTWLQHWLLTPGVTQQIEAGCDGAKMPRADWEHVGSIPVTAPSKSEQDTILMTLNRETARIDALIAKKTEFIELLSKKRQALITHAVTKGLAPKVKMKDSGVEWLGEVPAHWDVVRIKRAARISTNRSNVIPPGLAYIGLEDVESGSGQYKPTTVTSRQSEDSTVGLFLEGDVLYGKLRPYLRKCISVPMDGACSTEFLVLKPILVLATWLQTWLLTRDVTQQIESGCDGAKMPRADWDHVGSVPIPTPSKPEQNAILTTLSCETARIDALVAKTQRSIDLLKKRRSAFITAAVTGKIDLREVVT
jgi:type I restriction enzyme S subunit